MASGSHIGGVSETSRAPSPNDADPCRRWTLELAELRSRARKLKLNGVSISAPAGEILEDAFNICASLVRELAGARLAAKKLEDEVRSESAQWDYLFDQMTVPCISTDAQGRILNANRSAALFLNVSTKHLKERLLLHFAEDRDTFVGLLRRLEHERARIQAELTIRPRERAPRQAAVVAVPQTPENATSWLWFFVPGGLAGKTRRGQEGHGATKPEVAGTEAPGAERVTTT
jgi:PAS domain-containing protein